MFFQERNGQFRIFITIFLGILILLMGMMIYIASFYSVLMQKEQEVEINWSRLETPYEDRLLKITELVNLGEEKFPEDSETFTAIATIQTDYEQSTDLRDKIFKMNALEKSLNTLFVEIMNNPELNSISELTQLNEELEKDKTVLSQSDFNDSIRGYNLFITRFPHNILARIYGFQTLPFLED